MPLKCLNYPKWYFESWHNLASLWTELIYMTEYKVSRRMNFQILFDVYFFFLINLWVRFCKKWKNRWTSQGRINLARINWYEICNKDTGIRTIFSHRFIEFPKTLPTTTIGKNAFTAIWEFWYYLTGHFFASKEISFVCCSG